MTALHWAHLVVKPKGSLQLFFWYQSTRQTNVAGCSRHLIRHAGCLFLLVGLLSTNSLCALWISVHLRCMILHSWERLGSFFLVCLFPSLFSSLYSIYIFSLFLSIISISILIPLGPSWSVFGLWRCGRSCRSRRPLKSCMLIMLHLLVYLRSQRRELSHTCTMFVLWKEDVVCRVALTECVRLDILEIGRSQRPQREMPLIGVYRLS